MLFRIAIRVITHEREKLASAAAGVAVAVFLAVLQFGFYFGYRHDITSVLEAFDADIWIVPKGQPMFDGYTHLDDLAYWQVRGHRDIDAAARVVWGDATWRSPLSGGKDYVQVLGVECGSGIRLMLKATAPNAESLLRADGYVLIGAKDREKLGVSQAYQDGLEISGRRAVVAGFVEDIHLFTTAGFVMTDLDNARAYLGLPPSHCTYIAGKCQDGANLARVLGELQSALPEHEVLSSHAFQRRARDYWETRSGFGPVILLSSVLAVLVGFLIVMLTFYVSTLEKIPVYACFKAMGGSTAEIVFMLAVQVMIVFVLGSALGGAGVWLAILALRQTTISVVVSPNLVLGALGTMLLCSAIGSVLSIRKVVATEPGEAFRT